MGTINTPSHRSQWTYEQPHREPDESAHLMSPKATLRDKLARRSLAAKTCGKPIVTADGGEAALIGPDKELRLAPAGKTGYTCPICERGHACADGGCSHTTYLCHVTDAEADHLRSNGVSR